MSPPESRFASRSMGRQGESYTEPVFDVPAGSKGSRRALPTIILFQGAAQVQPILLRARHPPAAHRRQPSPAQKRRSKARPRARESPAASGTALTSNALAAITDARQFKAYVIKIRPPADIQRGVHPIGDKP